MVVKSISGKGRPLADNFGKFIWIVRLCELFFDEKIIRKPQTVSV
jgi:hypothetical protein